MLRISLTPLKDSIVGYNPSCLGLSLSYLLSIFPFLCHAYHTSLAAYDFLDPKKQGAFLVVYIIGIAVGQVVMFLVVRYAIILRERVVKKEDPIQHIPLGEGMVRKKTATIHDPTYLPGGEYNLQETRPFMNA